MPSCVAASAVTGPIAATTVFFEQIDGLLGAVDLGEVPDRRRARERHHVDAAVEQHAVDVRVAFLLRVLEHGAVGDDVGDDGARAAQLARR